MNQQNKQLTDFVEIFKSFFVRTFDYKSRSTRREHWIPVGTLYIILAIVYGGILLRIYNEYNSTFLSSVVSFETVLRLAIRNGAPDYIALAIVFALVHIPIIASFFRRLKDVGFNEIPAGALVGLYVLLLALELYFLVDVAVLLIIYFIAFFGVLMALPTNQLETTRNDDFFKLVFRQNAQAAAYYAQFNQQGFNPNMNQGFNPNGYQGQPNQFNPNGYQGQPNQGFNQNGYQGQPNQGFNPNNYQGQPNQGFNPNNYQGQPNQFNQNGYQGQPNQGFNQNGYQGQPNQFNPNGYQGQPNQFNQNGYQGQPNQFNQNGYQGQPNQFNPNGYQGQPNQGFNPNNYQGQPNQGFNPNGNQGQPNQGNPNGNQGQPNQDNPNSNQGAPKDNPTNKPKDDDNNKK